MGRIGSKGVCLQTPQFLQQTKQPQVRQLTRTVKVVHWHESMIRLYPAEERKMISNMIKTSPIKQGTKHLQQLSSHLAVPGDWLLLTSNTAILYHPVIQLEQNCFLSKNLVSREIVNELLSFQNDNLALLKSLQICS